MSALRVVTPRSDLARRTLIAIPLLAILIPTVIIGGWFFAWVVKAVGLICFFELAKTMRLPDIWWILGTVLLIAGVTQSHAEGQRDLILFCIVSVFGAACFAIGLGFLGVWHSLIDARRLLLAVVWVGGCLAHAVLLRDLSHGGALLTMVLAGTFFSDTCAYLVGKRWGKAKLAPIISPGKTVLGAVAGILAALVIICTIGLIWHPWITLGQSFALAVAVGLAALLGDLFESMVKRHYHTKDMSNLLGAHGSFLDRIDAILFAVAAGYWVGQSFGL